MLTHQRLTANDYSGVTHKIAVYLSAAEVPIDQNAKDKNVMQLLS